MNTTELPDKVLAYLKMLAHGEVITHDRVTTTRFRYGPPVAGGKLSLPERFLTENPERVWKSYAKINLSDESLIHLIEAACEAKLNYKIFSIYSAPAPAGDKKPDIKPKPKDITLKSKASQLLKDASSHIDLLIATLTELDDLFVQRRNLDHKMLTSDLDGELNDLREKLKSFNYLKRPDHQFINFATSSQKSNNTTFQYARGLIFLLHEGNFPFEKVGANVLIAEVVNFVCSDDKDGICNEDISYLIRRLGDFLKKTAPKSTCSE